MLRMPCRIRLRHHAAERLPEHNWFRYAKRIAEVADVVAPLRQRPRRRLAGHAAPVAAMVDVDNLRDIRETIEVGPKTGMIESGTAMQHDQRRLLAHLRTVDRKLGSNDVEEDALPVRKLNEHPYSCMFRI